MPTCTPCWRCRPPAIRLPCRSRKRSCWRACAPDPDTLYLHGLAVHPRFHGLGLGRRLALALFETARRQRLRHAALVAVLDARPFWESLGFRLAEPGQGAKVLASYPGAAAYMCRLLDA